MSKVRPPRKPRGEPLKITVANQDRQIKLLTERIVTLTTSLAQENRRAAEFCCERDDARRQLAGANQVIASLNNALQNITADVGRLRGYQERVREEDRNRYGDLPFIAPGS